MSLGENAPTVLLVETASWAGPPEASLSPEERRRADRLRDRAARHRFVAGRALLRQALGHHLRCPPGAVALRAAPRGKPELEGPAAPDGLRFNLSHSGGVVLLAFAAGAEIGVDVEEVRDGVDVAAIAARYFGPAEKGALAAHPPADRTGRFFQMWTMREALLKAAGLGLEGLDDLRSQPLPIPADAPRASAILDGAPWTVTSLPSFDPRYVAALAQPAPGRAPECWHWRPA